MRIAILMFLLLALTSCARNGVLIVQSPLPEFSQYVEEFNSYTRENFPGILASHQKKDFQRLTGTKQEDLPDVIIAPFLAAEERVPQFANLSQILPASFFTRPFYSEFLEKGKFRNRYYFLPLSFDLPILVSKREVTPSIVPYWMDFSQLVESTLEATSQADNGKLLQSGILEIDRLLIPTLYQLGLTFESHPEIFVRWDERMLEDGISRLQGWIQQLGGAEKLSAFADNRRLESLSSLFAQKQIRFAYLTAAEFFSLPENIQRPLMFRWYMQEEVIHVPEKEIYIGITRKSSSHNAAEIFLTWLFSESVQEGLIESTATTSQSSFGIAQGFSSLRSISELHIPRAYPALAGRFPLESQLRFAPSRSAHWEEYRSNILQPWLEERMRNDTPQSLQERTQEWYEQTIPYVK